MALTIVISDRDAATKLVTVVGKLDTTTSPQFDDDIAPALSSGASVTVLDLADLSYISSAGLRSVFKARKMMESKGGALLLVNVQPQVQKVFEIVKAMPVQTVFRSVTELDQYLDYMQKKVKDGAEPT
ncbi:MAG: STAS domain-containing protein [Blastocatellia bacterium]|jgi:anti-anti-sigma factor|nr:STAS domain-containing protein [Blastocatellia bacterium]